jgi:hypothetical protein
MLGTESYQQLCDAALASARHKLGQLIAGESANKNNAEAMAEFRTSLIERAIGKGSKVTAYRAEAFVDAFNGVRAERLMAGVDAAKSLEWLVKQTLKETEARVKLDLAGVEDAVLRERDSAKGTPPEGRQRRGGDDVPVIEVDDRDDPRDIPPPAIFGELGQVTIEWFLSETVHSFSCEEETPDAGSDDIIFQGNWRLNTESGKLQITSEEIDYDKGDIHFYDSTPQPTPHFRRKIAGDNRLSLYFSTHVLTENDGWSEIADAVAAALEDAISHPLSTIAGPLAGAFAGGTPGVGAAAGAAAAGADALMDNLSGDLLSKVGNEVGQYFHDVIAGIGADDNIIFECWNTVVVIRWVVDPRTGETVPRWSAHHAVPGRFRRLASPEAENPKTGEGTLSPSHFAGMHEVYVAPSNYPRDEYPEITGKYRYVSYVRVERKQIVI